MKFAFVADIHLSKYNQDPVNPTSGLPERLHVLKETLHQIADYCVEENIKVVVIGGDILHGKSIIHAIAQKVMLDFIRWYNFAITFYIIDGNHDLSGKSEQVISALEPLASEQNVRWIPYDKIRILNNITFIPYSYDIVSKIKENSNDILISHFGLSEGVLNSGISIVSNISLRDLRGRYKLVLLGHYHKPQEIIEDDISVYYVGSPIQLDWGEKNEEKRFLVVDSETLEVESIPTHGYRQHIQLEVTKENADKVLEQVEVFKKAGSHIKLVLKENVELPADEDVIVIDKTDRDITNRGISSSMTEEERMKRYLEIKEIQEEEHDLYLNTGLALIEGDFNAANKLQESRNGELRSIQRPS